jgi:glycerol uptake facilitator protein
MGTMMLVLFVSGAVIVGSFMGEGPLNHAEPGSVALSFVVIVIYVFGSTSGAHINPAVTTALAVGRRFSRWELPGRIGAQVAGAGQGAATAIAGGRRPSEPLPTLTDGRHDGQAPAPVTADRFSGRDGGESPRSGHRSGSDGGDRRTA